MNHTACNNNKGNLSRWDFSEFQPNCALYTKCTIHETKVLLLKYCDGFMTQNLKFGLVWAGWAV